MEKIYKGLLLKKSKVDVYNILCIKFMDREQPHGETFNDLFNKSEYCRKAGKPKAVKPS